MAESLSIQSLNDRWSEIKASQGFIGKAWNGIKEFTHLGKSESKCEGVLDDYRQGKVSLSQAIEYIEDFNNKQEAMTDLIANVATGVGSIAVATVAVAGGSIGPAIAIAKGAPTGAVLKTSIKALDRATNDIDDDVLNGKELIKDAVSGATTGATSAVSSKIFEGVREATKTMSVAQGLKTTVLNGTKCGLICGAASGAINYSTNAVLDDDKKFNFGDLTRSTLTSSAISGTVGAAVGSGVFGVESALGNLGQSSALSTSGIIVRDSALSSARKVLGNAEKQLVNA
ncbi:MAG: hypothetical protein IJ877_07260 [Candidatus Gastranaerophilales bacterium]|nr:hypothetical protein [Candidatus Gastranaerophilales bacterium]